LHVIDPAGQPVVGAQVHGRASGSWSIEGETDSRGYYVGNLRTGVVRHGAFMPNLFDLPEDQTEATITLKIGGVLEGRVLGLQDGEPVVVVARDDGSDPWERDSGELREGHPRVRKCITDADGRFLIKGLLPGRLYFVEAFNRRGACAFVRAIAGTVREPGFAELLFRPLLGCVLKFTGPSGGPLKVSPRISLLSSQPGLPLTPHPPPGLAYPKGLLGLTQAQLTRNSNLGWHGGTLTRFVSFVAPEDPGGPPGAASMSMPFELELPGYERFHGELSVGAPKEDGGFPTQTFPLTPRVANWGDLHVEILGTEYLDDFPPRVRLPEYQLRLQGDGVRLAYTFRPPLKVDPILRDIPQGLYRAELIGLGKPLSEGPVDVQIGATQSKVSFDLALYGGIQVTVVNADGSTYDATSLAISVIRGADPHKGVPSYYRLMGPPYVVRHLASGPYYLWMDEPVSLRFQDPDAAGLADTVYVSGSHITTVQFVLE
jgi:hypothetical protein